MAACTYLEVVCNLDPILSLLFIDNLSDLGDYPTRLLADCTITCSVVPQWGSIKESPKQNITHTFVLVRPDLLDTFSVVLPREGHMITQLERVAERGTCIFQERRGDHGKARLCYNC